MRTGLILAAALTFTGCAVRESVIASYQGGGKDKVLQSCKLEFWWETAQLERFCGAPKWKVGWMGHGNGASCWIYENQSAGDAEYTAVCLAPEEDKLRVKEEIGLRSSPDGKKMVPAVAPRLPAISVPPPPPPPPPPADPNAPPPPEPSY